jgi:hypothetical protein
MIAAALFVLAAGLAVYLLLPAFVRIDPDAPDPRAPLEAARAAEAQALRDLELDWGTGKLSDDEYRAQRTALRAEADALVRPASEALRE